MSIDIEDATVVWLSDELDPVRVVTELPANLADELPIIQVARVGGPTIGRLDRASVDVDVYDTGLIPARLIAGQAIDVLKGFAGQKVTGGVITKVDVPSGPSKRPYDNTKVRRVGATVVITALAKS